MNLHRFLIPSAVAVVLSVGAVFAEDASHWTYEGHEGPDTWGDLSPDFAICKTGAEQSPIDLSHAIPADAPNVEIHWNPAAVWTLANNGHTIQANTTDGGTITLDGKDYVLLQFHFHDPSEHTVDGKHFPMEVHFVHKAADGALAVVGVFMTGGGATGLLDSVMAVAPAKKGEVALEVHDVKGMIPVGPHFFRYEGSLTTPPCSQTVVWTVMKEPIAVSDAAIAKFHALFEMNARPVQPLNRRFVLSK